MGKIDDCRNSKKCRMSVIWGLMLLVLLLAIFMKKGTVVFMIIFALLAGALAIDGFNKDFDLQKMWKTGSYEQSRVQTVKDKNGKSVRLITWTCTKWKWKNDFDLNCKDFSTWEEAQAKYNKCAEEIKKNNPEITDIKDFDIYWLDKNHNWIVCESLPWAPKITK